MSDTITVEKILNRLSNFIEKNEESTIYKIFQSLISSMNDFIVNKDNMQKAVLLSTAEGSEIDEIGRIFKLSRDVGETDSQLRSRILGYWTGVEGSTKSAIQNAASKMTGVDPDQIVVTDLDALRFKVDISVGENLDLYGTVSEFITTIKPVGTEALYGVKSAFTDPVNVTEITAIEVLVGITRIYGEFIYGDDSSIY